MARVSWWCFLVSSIAALCGLVVVACSAAPASGFDDTPSQDAAATPDGGSPIFSLDAGGDGGRCLECQQVDCGSGKPTTTISGIVYDPAGRRPLYNVFVYVPSGTPEAIPAGNVQCSQCQAAASGHPLVTATTDTAGRFVIQNAPVGDNIPLVMQVGKWRRQIVIPHVSACVDNVQTDKNQTRLPGKSSEGDMPLMAFTSGGCDVAECFLRRIGIDDSEFVPPSSATGHVHFYTGQGGGSTVKGGNTWQDTYAWWKDPKNLLAYDLIFNACECSPLDRNSGNSAGDAYKSMHAYVDGGGRLFATHYYYNWFAQPTGPADFQSVAHWLPGGQGIRGISDYYIDTSFPKGKALSDWLQAQNVTKTPGVIALDESQIDITNDVGTVNPAATRWIYHGTSANDPKYLSKFVTFNAPVGAPTVNQCGRAVFSEFHLAAFGSGVFPAECAKYDPSHDNNEAALEFLFFDLSSCVQDDPSQPPPPPPR